MKVVDLNHDILKMFVSKMKNIRKNRKFSFRYQKILMKNIYLKHEHCRVNK